MPNYANSHMRNCLNPTFALSELDNYGYAREKSSCLSGFETIRVLLQHTDFSGNDYFACLS